MAMSAWRRSRSNTMLLYDTNPSFPHFGSMKNLNYTAYSHVKKIQQAKSVKVVQLQ